MDVIFCIRRVESQEKRVAKSLTYNIDNTTIVNLNASKFPGNFY